MLQIDLGHISNGFLRLDVAIFQGSIGNGILRSFPMEHMEILKKTRTRYLFRFLDSRYFLLRSCKSSISFLMRL